jgi:hypothetical protein
LTSRRSKKKKAKNTIGNKTRIYVIFSIDMLLLLSYFVIVFVIEGQLINKCYVTTNEMNMTASIEPYYWFALNA